MNPNTPNPTIGQRVWFFKRGTPGPLAAIVAAVLGNSLVNLTVFLSNGNTLAAPNVTLLADGQTKEGGDYATWIPVGTAAQQEAIQEFAGQTAG